jgi:hypothetical protein
MPRYFFDLSGSSAPRDVVGVELADDGAARQEAILMAQSNGHLLPTFGTNDAVVVRNARGVSIFTTKVKRQA